MPNLALEVYSSIITGFAAVMSVIAYRAGGPKISARGLLIKIDGSKKLVVEVYNNGRGDATIDILGIELSYFYSSRQIKEQSWKPQFEGEPLPYRLKANSFNKWQASAEYFDVISNLQDPFTKLHVVLQIGGRRSKRRIRAEITKPIVYKPI